MSDEYGRLSEVRTGLYWGTIIREMPKYKYNKHYGTLTMVPFITSWLNLFTMPAFLCVKERGTLASLNNVVFCINYLPVSIVVLAVFMAVNLILLPFAYFKTVAHKIALVNRLKNA